MTGMQAEDGRRADLYVRSLAPTGARGPQAAVVDRLSSLTEGDRLTDFSTHVWGKQAPASPAEARTDAGAYALDRVAVFREWARHNDVSLDPAFELREVEAEIRETSYRSIVFPTVLLAEYRDGELVCVTPHETETGVRTVADRLGRLERAEATEYDSIEQAREDPPTLRHVDAEPEPVPSE